MRSNFNESTVEQAALEWFADLGYQTLYGPNISPGGDNEQLRDGLMKSF
jgi:type I restriction enzyme, R subunit